MTIYKVAVVGCGRIASEFEGDDTRGHPSTHIGAYSYLESTEIVAICDIDKD